MSDINGVPEAREVPLRSLIIQVGDYLREFWKNKVLVVIITGLVLIAAVINIYVSPPYYVAELTFMLNEEDEGGGASALLGQFGLGGGSAGDINLNKIIELAKSRKIIGTVLFQKRKLGGSDDFLANHIIDLYDLHENWEDSGALKGLKFSHGEIDSFSVAENAAFKILHQMFVRGGIMSLKSDEMTKIFSLNMKTLNENLSIYCSDLLFENLETFYVEKSVNKQRATYAKLKQRADSLDKVLTNKQLALLRFEDNNRSLGLRQYEIGRLKLEGEIQKLIGNYGESFKQLTIAEYNLQNETPFISTIDEPIKPLKREDLKYEKELPLALAAGLILSFIIIALRKTYRDVMNEK